MSPLPAILVHGGAGPRDPELEAVRESGLAEAVSAGWEILSRQGTALDAVTEAVSVLEANPAFNAGIGSVLNLHGKVEMDASIMDGSRLAAGAVAAVSRVAHPIRLARMILEDGRHVLLTAAGAEAFARDRGVPAIPPSALVTDRQWRRWVVARGERETVGAVALDRQGHLAAATSTGGRVDTLPGRVGDSAVIGAGTFADDRAGAASATGHGESIILAGLARAAVDGAGDGSHPAVIARRVVRALGERCEGEAGIILVDRFGRLGWATSAESMAVASRSATSRR